MFLIDILNFILIVEVYNAKSRTLVKEEKLNFWFKNITFKLIITVTIISQKQFKKNISKTIPE